MKVKKQIIVLLCLFLFTALFRIFLAFQNPNFNYEAYFKIRQVEQIDSTGKPLYTDNLSYGGRVNEFPPFFYYFLAFFGLFLPKIAAFKIIPNIMAASIVIITYYISYELTKKASVSLIASFFSAFTVSFFALTINNISIFTLTVPLFFLAIYFLINIEKKRNMYFFLAIVLLLVLTHPIIFIFIPSLTFFIILLKIESLKIRKSVLEILLFLTFLILLSYFLIYKKSFLFHGMGIIWNNMPQAVLVNYFKDIIYIQTIISIGFIPLVLGIFSIYHVLFKFKNTSFMLIVSFCFAFFIFMLLRLIKIEDGFIFIGILLSILSAHTLDLISKYFHKTKFKKTSKIIILIITLIFILTSFFQSTSLAIETTKEGPAANDLNALLWLKNNSVTKQAVLGPIEEGFLISYYTNRTNVVDDNFLLIKNINSRYADVQTLFKSRLKTEALTILEKYNVKYIYLSENYFKQNKQAPYFLDDESCFPLIYNQSVKVYKIDCRII